MSAAAEPKPAFRENELAKQPTRWRKWPFPRSSRRSASFCDFLLVLLRYLHHREKRRLALATNWFVLEFRSISLSISFDPACVWFQRCKFRKPNLHQQLLYCVISTVSVASNNFRFPECLFVLSVRAVCWCVFVSVCLCVAVSLFDGSKMC